MQKRVFTAEEWEELGLPHECEGGEIIEDRMVRHKRWSIVHEVTFRLGDQQAGEAWRAKYEVPATECQENGDDDPKSYTATLVRAVERFVTVYEPIE